MRTEAITTSQAIKNSGRMPGLDLLRAVAVSAVILHHYPHAESQPILRAIGGRGWVGVDLFFALSGYLVGGKYFAEVARGRPVSIQGFYYRRAMRILPNYLVVLGCYLVLHPMRCWYSSDLWRYLTFTQNFGVPRVFIVSWSLCVEQHFYVAFPLVAWLVLLSFSVFGVAFSLLVAVSVSPASALSRIRIPGIETLAVWSYAIYLTHGISFNASNRICERFGVESHGFAAALVRIVVVAGFGAALFYCVERVFLRMRDRRSRHPASPNSAFTKSS